MNKKYELLKDDYIEFKGKTLYRIKALRNFDDVKAGDLGGYIEKEDNLGHYRDCWVYDNAKVFGNARVYEHARVYDNAEVYEHARVYGNVLIDENAEVHGNAEVYDNAKVYQNAKVFNNAKITCNARVYGNAKIEEDTIIGKVSIPYKKIFQYQCKQRILTAILTEDDKILYSIGCQHNITEKEFIDRIHNENGGLKLNPHRNEYLELIKTIKTHFKGE